MIALSNISISSSEKLGFFSNLATMLSAGISFIESIDSLLEDAKGNQKKVLEVMRDDLIQGKRLYTSFAKFPGVFDKVIINIIKAAEEAGTLDVTLVDLKNNIKREIEFSDRVKSSLIYPVVIIIVFIAVLIIILTFVMPKISSVFDRLQINLPITTKLMIFASNMLITYTIPIILAVVLLFAGLVFLYKSNKRYLLSLITSFPIISKLAKDIDLTRFSRSMGLLLSSGLPITTALDLTHDMMMKKEISDAVEDAKNTVLAGKKLSEGLKYHKKIVPSIMIKIIEAGEKSGTLDKSMQDITEYLDYQISKSLKTITVLMEPIILVFIGIFVGGMMLSILTPIYGLISQVGNR